MARPGWQLEAFTHKEQWRWFTTRHSWGQYRWEAKKIHLIYRKEMKNEYSQGWGAPIKNHHPFASSQTWASLLTYNPLTIGGWTLQQGGKSTHNDSSQVFLSGPTVTYLGNYTLRKRNTQSFQGLFYTGSKLILISRDFNCHHGSPVTVGTHEDQVIYGVLVQIWLPGGPVGLWTK